MHGNRHGQRTGQRKVAVCNGCFDLLHAGHVHLFREARSIADRLIVLLNSDESIRKLKGKNRPINSQSDRSAVLLALADVDEVVVFDSELELKNLISVIQPAFLVKGDDYRDKIVTGADLLGDWGGQMIFVKRVPGKSTTGIAKQIGKNCQVAKTTP